MRALMKPVLFLIAAIILFLAVCLVRAFMFTSTSENEDLLALPAAPAIDIDVAAGKLSEAITYQTITLRSGDPRPGQNQPWLDFHAFVQRSFPALSAQSTFETVADSSLMITWQGSNPDADPIILMGHLDVVPVDFSTLDGWNHSPFEGVISEGYVYGRGTMDCKGPIVAMLEAAELLAASGWVPERSIIFQYGHDEEVGGTGAEAMFNLQRERGIRPYFVLDEGMEVLETYALTGQPAALIGVSEKGYRSYRITAVDNGGHAAIPRRNTSAVRLGRALAALDDNQMPIDLTSSPFPEAVRSMADDLPFKIRFAMANSFAFGWMMESVTEEDVMFNAMLRTTAAPTMLAGSNKDNVLPPNASAVVNFRLHPSDTAEDLEAHMRRVLDPIGGMEFELITAGIVADPSPVSSIEGLPYRILESVASDTGEGVPVIPGMVVGSVDARFAAIVTDENIFRFVPTVYSNEDMGGMHGTNERLSLENLERMITGYSRIMMMGASVSEEG
ncbi:M20/M25/M40 family metallo-hydrolase [Ponticaulis sp.]|uniref:M20/M25/M40 family metallo-hydrolase n=1 Tax=Ponticaulis sp. TaxID=2020902 RepID=UPI000B6C4335|nr:M20/M25/M40 family metallo-hydrolase [Ponticaulis sp.]MAI91211.1 hypothetical protein [Ponticaulis sp.]OUX98524.1 MAG: hypothetical protein CBB65_12255 [Hyphomonadaceae bacterium TMED5]|tara:strand:+ start:76159 stop:77667 length:1509 start_codon:yes stop_codon:yes gene_type:complete